MKEWIGFLVFLLYSFSVTAKESIFQAAIQGNTEEILRLLSEGEDINQRHGKTGWTPLHAACYYGRTEVVQLLISKKAEVNAVDKKNATPLMKAVLLGPYEDQNQKIAEKAIIIRVLLKAGADPHIRDVYGQEPWEIPLLEGYEPMIQAFEEAGVRGVKETKLMIAIASAQKTMVRQLIQEGADVNYKDEKGWSALREAVLSQDPEMLSLIIDAGGDVNQKFEKGWTVLMMAVQLNQPEMVSLLLKSGALSDAKNDSGESSLDIARRLEREEIIKILEGQR